VTLFCTPVCHQSLIFRTCIDGNLKWLLSHCQARLFISISNKHSVLKSKKVHLAFCRAPLLCVTKYLTPKSWKNFHKRRSTISVHCIVWGSMPLKKSRWVATCVTIYLLHWTKFWTLVSGLWENVLTLWQNLFYR